MLQTDARLKFEVASIKPAALDARGMFIHPGPNGGLRITNMTLKELIVLAWRVQPFQISGGPSWLDSVHYDILAKPEVKPKQGEITQMLQSLLKDRFQLTFHRETKELPLYAMVMARKEGKLGPGLKESKEGDLHAAGPREAPASTRTRQTGCALMRPNDDGLQPLDGRKRSGREFGPHVLRFLGRTVVDKTGLLGNFDISMEWPPDQSQAMQLPPSLPPPPPSDAAGPSIFTAFQEQLGLKLESQKGPVENLIIERVEKPSEN